MKPARLGLRALPGLLALLGLAGLAGCASSGPPPAIYYVALGDSLSVGVQPDATGASVPTGQGYADQLFASLRTSHPGLQLVKLGCPGETTASMTSGGRCAYRDGSQLATAEAFLHAHQGHVFLVTLDIGANDVERCATLGSVGAALSCLRSVFSATSTPLNTVLSRLHAAAGAGTQVVGMNYYMPLLARWRSGYLGEELARLTVPLTSSYNQQLADVYSQYGMPVADVFGAFATPDFGDSRAVPGFGTLPRNVALICQWTWACAPPPRGPNQHANQTGYGVIATAFAQAGSLK